MDQTTETIHKLILSVRRAVQRNITGKAASITAVAIAAPSMPRTGTATTLMTRLSAHSASISLECSAGRPAKAIDIQNGEYIAQEFTPISSIARGTTPSNKAWSSFSKDMAGE